jgi:hypothetical protein
MVEVIKNSETFVIRADKVPDWRDKISNNLKKVIKNLPNNK